MCRKFLLDFDFTSSALANGYFNSVTLCYLTPLLQLKKLYRFEGNEKVIMNSELFVNCLGDRGRIRRKEITLQQDLAGI